MSMGDPKWMSSVGAPIHGTHKIFVDDHVGMDYASMAFPKITPMAQSISVEDEHGLSMGTLSHDELVKYMRERELVATNETVRTLWERYQVAVRLVGRENHGPAD